MDIQYLNPDLREMNGRLRAAFAAAAEMPDEQIRHCRWRAMDMCPPNAALSASQQELVGELREIVGFARDRDLEEVVGWCMAANQGLSIGAPPAEIGATISEFVLSSVPPPARLLDVAAGTGRRSLPFATCGYRLSLFEPAAAFLEVAHQNAKTQGIGAAVENLICGTFKDLARVESKAYDVSVCIESLLYATPRQAAEDTLSNLARISSGALVVDVASKYGMLLQLGVEGEEVSAASIKQLLATGVTPPASAENGHVTYSCFSSEDFRSVLASCGLEVARLVGHGEPGILARATAELMPAVERNRIEGYLAADETPVDIFPNILALCSKESTQGSDSDKE